MISLWVQCEFIFLYICVFAYFNLMANVTKHILSKKYAMLYMSHSMKGEEFLSLA